MDRGAGQPEHVRRKRVGGGGQGGGSPGEQRGGVRGREAESIWGREAGAEIKKAIVCRLLLGII